MKTKLYSLIYINLLLMAISFAEAQPLSFNSSNKVNFNIIKSSDFDCGVISPGCPRTIDNGNNCLTWQVSCDQSEASFKVRFQNPANASLLNLDWVWMYQDDNSGTWKYFDDNENPTGAMNHTGNVFDLDQNGSSVVKFRVCNTFVLTNDYFGTKQLSFDFGISIEQYP